MKRRICFFIIIILLAGCKKEPEPENPGAFTGREILIGRWNWSGTTEKMSGHEFYAEYIMNPSSESQTYAIEFRENGTCGFIKNEIRYENDVVQFGYWSPDTTIFKNGISFIIKNTVQGIVSRDSLVIKDFPYLDYSSGRISITRRNYFIRSR